MRRSKQQIKRRWRISSDYLLEAALTEGDEDARQELAEQVLLEFGSNQLSSLRDLYGSAYAMPPLLSPPGPVLPSNAEIYSFAFDKKLAHLVRQESSVLVYKVKVMSETYLGNAETPSIVEELTSFDLPF